MRRFGRAAIAASVALSGAFSGALSAAGNASVWLHVNAYDDGIEARRLEARREEAHREDERREQERLAEARREARIDAYNAWLAHWHEMRSRGGMTP